MRGRKQDVVLSAPGTRVRDAEGRWTALGDDVTVMAHVAPAANAVGRRDDDRERAGRDTQNDAVVLLPRGTSIDTSYQIILAATGVVPDGSYRVRKVTRTMKHVRVGLVKVEP